MSRRPKRPPAEEMPRRGWLLAALWKSRAPTPLAPSKCGRLYRSAHTRAFELVLSETNLAETRKDRLDVLTDMLAHARKADDRTDMVFLQSSLLPIPH